MSLPKRLLNKLEWIWSEILWLISPKPEIRPKIANDNVFTIGITTFMDRFDNCLKPLVKRIAVLFPECQIIVVANGHVKQNEQEEYLDLISQYCSQFVNVELFTYRKPKGLSYIWNRIVEYSNHEKVLLLNDDLA